MAKMTIMIGLPASGKSTKAKELLEHGNTVRINKDLIREMLHFNKFNGRNEGNTRDAARSLASMFLKSGMNVIIDDTNLNPGTLQSWVDLAKECDAKIEYIRMDTAVRECIRRDDERRELGQRYVGKHVIVNMAMQYGLMDFGDNTIIVSDLDGTIANIDNRLKYAKGETKDWKKFFEGIPNDTLITETVDKINEYKQKNMPLILVSARPEDYRNGTEKWLKEKGIEYETLIMRRSNDKRDDVEVKQDIYDNYLKKYNIAVWFDDRPKVIRMLRSNGINVVDVGQGIEF